MLQQIMELFLAALLGAVVTLAISWLLVQGKLRVMRNGLQRLDRDFNKCHEEHIECPDKIKDECQESIRKLALVVDDLTKTTSLISGTLDAHLRVSQQLDTATEQRFARIEQQLNRIETKLDQLKGWRLVEN